MTNEPPTNAPPPDEGPVLTAQLSQRWAIGPAHLVSYVLLGSLFLLLSHLPLRPNDLWCHVGYGEWILDYRGLPAEDPFMPLSAGMQVTDNQWLAQVVLAAVYRAGGPESLSLLFTITMLGIYVVGFRTYYRQSHSWVVALIVTLIVLGINWSRISTIRPENFAVLCFAFLLLLIVGVDAREGSLPSSRRRWRLYVGVPAVMLLWTNLHGSYPVGIATLVCWCAGYGSEVAWRRRSMLAPLRDRRFRRWVIATQLSIVATLFNPYGIDLWLQTIVFLNNSNLSYVLEWKTLELMGPAGRGFVASWVVLLILMRHSRVRVPVAHVLLLAITAMGATLHVRMISWYGLVFGVAAAPHVANIALRLSRFWQNQAAASPVVARLSPLGQRSFRYTLVAALCLWLAFALSPASRILLGGNPRPAERIYHADTPLALTKYLRDNPIRGLMYNPQYWGDWLYREGSPGLQVFANSNVHLVPHQVWLDYRRISEVQAGWDEVLERYGVNTLVVDKKDQASLWSIVRGDDNWDLKYEDSRAALLVKYVAARKPAAAPTNRSD